MSELDKKDLGIRLRGFRLARSLSLLELAKITGIPKSSLTLYERGQRTPPGHRMVMIMAALDIKPIELVDMPVEV